MNDTQASTRKKIYMKKYYQTHHDEIIKRHEKYRKTHRLEARESSRKYRQNNREKINMAKNESRKKHPDTARKHAKKHRETRGDEASAYALEYARNYYQKNMTKVKELHKKYHSLHRDKINESSRKYYKARKSKLNKNSLQRYHANRDNITRDRNILKIKNKKLDSNGSNEIKIDQILYTVTDKDPKHGLTGGYAVAAKSEGITDGLLKFLEYYHYPLGQNDHGIFNFNPYKSLTRYRDRLIYTVARTGVGHDGRGGTYNTHHFVFNECDFIQINNDTRHLDVFVFEMPHTLRSLNVLTIYPTPDETIPAPSFPQIGEIQKALREKKKVVILTKEKILPDMQSIILCLKPEERVITWCNRVTEPDRQPAFNFIAGDHHTLFNMPKKWKIFDLTECGMP